MRVATKLGLAERFERIAAHYAYLSTLAAHKPSEQSLLADSHDLRAAAYALRRLTTEQEVDFLEFQFGGPDGIGVDSYQNPITVSLPPPPKPPEKKRPFWKTLLWPEVSPAYGHGTQ